MTTKPEPRVAEARLIMPDPAYGEGYVEALREGFRDGSELGTADAAGIAAIAADLPAHLATLNAQGGTMRLNGGREVEKVPFAHFWMVTDDWFIGRVGIRYGLNEGLRLWGGHIGYEIRPSLWRRGFGRQALTLGIAHTRAHGLTASCSPAPTTMRGPPASSRAMAACSRAKARIRSIPAC